MKVIHVAEFFFMFFFESKSIHDPGHKNFASVKSFWFCNFIYINPVIIFPKCNSQGFFITITLFIGIEVKN